ncbi:dynein regulatory complex protein 1 [Orussus abietinus]|uniref:dynein regulatory complex protein 1 n=1 Tax=Orussus abietinus TaxID=222816 RepID=UPI0006259651|nr:dynein regulatory complex protein 1 [Orussus abietinus]
MASEKTQENEYDEPVEPSVTSADPNERKLARRLRIQRRLEALKKQEGSEEEEVIEKTPTEKQILASAEILEKLISEGDEVITNVRVANDAREVQRRKDEAALRKKLLNKLEEVASDCLGKYNVINKKWEEVLGFDDPLNIHHEMQAQNAKCLEVLAEKDAVIDELKKELENADIKFAADQRKQIDNINLLIERIDSQVNTMAKAYRRELALIENALESERTILLETVAKKWEVLYKQRNEEELSGIEERKEIMREYEIEMKKVMEDHQEKYRAQKIWLETEHQNLQQEVQNMKAICMMNVEKLDYSYAVLKRREDENIIVKNQQKRRINKLQDVINRLKKNYADLEESTKLDIQRLTEQVTKAHKNILELEEKSDHFTSINERQYLNIWDMNEKSAKELVDKIMTADKIIYEQTLGLEWEPPEEPLLSKEDLPSYCAAMCSLRQKSFEIKENKKVCEKHKPATDLQEINLERQLLRRIIIQISDRCGFLIEDRLRELLAPHSSKDKIVIKLDNVFQALGIKSEDEVDLLLNFFLPYSYCPICTASDQRMPSICSESETLESSDGSSSASKSDTSNTDSNAIDSICNYQSATGTESRKRQVCCDKGHLLEIQALSVSKALKEFIARFHTVKRGQVPPTFQAKLTNEKLTISRALTVQDVTEFWRRYRDIFSSKKEKLWDGLLIGLHKYHEILKERHKLNMETECLRKQNSELHRLLETHTLKPGEILPSLKIRSINSA